MSPHPPPPHLTLDNFNIESEVPEACPFVLTSPRSLEACRRTGVQVGQRHYGSWLLVSPLQLVSAGFIQLIYQLQ